LTAARRGSRIDTGDKVPRLWNLHSSNPAESAIELHHEDYVTDVAISPDDRWIVTGSGDRTARLWDLTSDDVAKSSILLRGHKGESVTVAISPNSQWLATVGGDVMPRLWDLKARDPSQGPILLEAQEEAVEFVAFSGDSHWLATGGPSQRLRLWDLRASPIGERSVELAGQYPGVSSNVLRTSSAVQFSPDGACLAAIGGGEKLLLWDLTIPDAFSRDPIVLPDKTTTFAFSPDGHRLVTAATFLTITPDSRRHATSRNGRYSPYPTVLVWDLTDPDFAKTPMVLSGPEGGIGDVAISPDNRWLLAGSTDGRGYLWELETAQARSPIILRGHPVDPGDSLFGLPVTIPAGERWLVTGHADGSARLWPFRLETLLEQARQAVGRNFTSDEWKQYFPNQLYRKTFDALPDAD
jgi:WD40 repeat protein